MRKTQITLSNFSGGLYTKLSAAAIPDSCVSEASNVIFDDGSPIAQRFGFNRFSQADLTGKPHRTLFYFELSNGTRAVIAGVRNTAGGTNELYSYSESGVRTGPLTGGTGFSTTYEFEMAVGADNLYIVNGVDATQRYDGSAVVAAGVDGLGAGGSGAATQDTPPSASAPYGGPPGIPASASGGYRWSYAYVYGSRGESWASQESIPAQLPSNQLIDLTNIKVGPSGTTARRIYRRDLASSTNPRVFVGEITNNTVTTFTDNNANLDLARKARTISAIPPVCFYTLWHKNRMFYFRQTGDGSAWWRSELRTPDIVLSTSQEFTANGDGDVISGVAKLRDRIVIFKQRSVWVLEGDSPNEWRQVPVDLRIGCSDNRSIQVTPRGVIFFGQQGFWLFDGVRLNYLSEAVEPQMQAIVQGTNSISRLEWTSFSDWTTSGFGTGSGGSGVGLQLGGIAIP